MSSVLASVAPFHDFDEDAWDDLLNYIEERRVIPIIGPDLLRVQTDRGLMPLYEWLAGKLASRLSVDPAGLPQPLTLNDVVCSYLGQRGLDTEVGHPGDFQSSVAARVDRAKRSQVHADVEGQAVIGGVVLDAQTQ